MIVITNAPDALYLADVLQEVANISDDQAALLVNTAVTLAHLRAELMRIEKQCVKLRKQPLCTASCISIEHNRHGAVRYRAVHGKNVSCPIHGVPAPGQRIRIRIRTREVDWLRTAIQCSHNLTRLAAEAACHCHQINQIEQALHLFNTSALQPEPDSQKSVA